MRKLLSLLYIALTVFMTFSLCADADETKPYRFGIYEPSYKSRLPVGFNWLFQRYDLDRIEEYFDEYYIDRYKYWEKYLISKQREFAGKFGLSDIFLKPDLRRYENTKLALSKSVWNDRLLFRYLAPVGDVRDFDLSVAFRPYHFMTFIMRGQMSGEQRVALVVSQPFGRGKSNREVKRLRRLLGQAKKLAE